MDSKLTIVANAAAGTTDREVVEVARNEIASRGGDVDLRWTADTADLGSVVATCEADRLVVVGGDGSISAAVHALVEAGRGDLPVALVPLGTGNDLARAMGIPSDVRAAARLALEGRPAARPVIRMGARTAVNALHLGIGAAAADRASGLKSLFGPAAYPLGALAAGAVQRGWDLEVAIDDREAIEVRALLCACMLGTSIGGGTEVVSEAARADVRTRQEAEVVLVGSSGPIARVGFGLDLVRGDHLGREDVVHGRARRVAIRSEPPVPVNLDGELEDPLEEVVVEVVGEQWNLILGDTTWEGGA